MKSFNNTYLTVKKHQLLVTLVLAGAFILGSFSMGYNPIENLNELLNKYYKFPFDKLMYFAIAYAALELALDKHIWLPFLGDSVLPDQLVPLKNNLNYNHEVVIKAPPGSKVAYWAANAHIETPYVFDAYGNYENSGVVMANENGEATLRVIKGSGYITPSGRYIQPHVHYRIFNKEIGMMDQVNTVMY